MFIAIGSYFILNIAVIVVLIEFQTKNTSKNDYQKALRKVLLLRAFETLDENCKGYIDKSDIKLLIDDLFLNYSDFQRAGIPKDSIKNTLVDIVDMDGDGNYYYYHSSYYSYIITVIIIVMIIILK